MICPLMSYQRQHTMTVRCEEGNCGWWDNTHNQCCIKTVAMSKVNITNNYTPPDVFFTNKNTH